MIWMFDQGLHFLHNSATVTQSIGMCYFILRSLSSACFGSNTSGTILRVNFLLIVHPAASELFRN